MAYLSESEAKLLEGSMPRHVAKVTRLMDAFEKRTGKRTRVVGGFRGPGVQAKIYADSLKAGGRKGQGYRAAPPGQSKHEQGAATDLNVIGETAGDAAADARNPYYKILAEEARKVGLKPGLDFKGGLPDPYHVEEPDGLEALALEFAALARRRLWRLVLVGALVGAVTWLYLTYRKRRRLA